jgi:AraC-like DNA-binding protein
MPCSLPISYKMGLFERQNSSMRYFVHKPCAPLSTFVDYLWSLSDTPCHAHERILPSGTSEMVIDVSGTRESGRRFQGAVVSGCFSGPFDIDTQVHKAGLVGIHFRPGGAARLLGLQAGEIANRHVGLEALWGRRASELRERLCVAGDPRRRFMILEQTLVAGLRGIRTERGAVKVALAELERPRVEVGQIAEKVGLSRRRLIEIFTHDVGMTPKHYSRVRRFQRGLALATRTGSPAWAQVALECGYFDQAHLCRDWTEFTGLSPTEFLALRATPVKDNHVALPEACP